MFFLAIWCSFIGVSQSDIRSLGEIPQEILETSGLIFYNGRLITHNDSGNAPELYELDAETLQITRTIQVLNAQNIDWEDITQDSDFIYIGDIGNNQGNRQDLGILKIAKTEFDRFNEVNAERINFLYEDQTDFTTTPDSDFDAEALFTLDDNLFVLTKQWQSEGTVAYKIPKTPGSFLAERLDTYQVDGLVTGATFDDTSGTLYLIGYSRFLIPFFIEVPRITSDTIFSGEPVKTELDIGPSQVEALTFANTIFYASSEEFTNPPLRSSARLFAFSLDEGESSIPTPIGETQPTEELVVYKMANSTEVNFELNSNKPIFGMGIFDSQGRILRYTPLERIAQDPIDISILNQGLYYLAFFYNNSVISAPFFRD
ncbi:MAG: hypothetical protein AAF039_13925 [Bacteroidota bacterium]